MKKMIASLVPYAAVAVGLYWLRNAWLAMLAYHAGMAFFLGISRRHVDFAGLARGWRPGVFALIIPLYLSAGALIYLLWPHVKFYDVSLLVALAELGLSREGLVGFAVYYCLVNPPLEELFWRAWLGGDSNRPVWQDFLFAGYHGLVMAMFVTVPWAIVSVLLLGAAAWLWRLMNRSWGGLAMPHMTHFVADVGVMVAVWLLLG